MKRRFGVIEYDSGFAVFDKMTKKEAWISDGVDLLFTPTGKPVNPGSKGFCKKLAKALNYAPEETFEAYFG